MSEPNFNVLNISEEAIHEEKRTELHLKPAVLNPVTYKCSNSPTPQCLVKITVILASVILSRENLILFLQSVGMTAGKIKRIVFSVINNDRSLSFLIGLEEWTGKLCYSKPVIAVSLMLEASTVVVGTTVLLLGRTLRYHPSTDTAEVHRHTPPLPTITDSAAAWAHKSYAAEALRCLLLLPYCPTTATAGRHDAADIAGLSAATALHGTLYPSRTSGAHSSSEESPTQEYLLLFSCIFLFPTFQYPFSVPHWKNLTRSQLARNSENCGL